ncbi:MFS transporter [Burkholderia metallica]|uniref:MFS transporter n=1 Tax=Burkholderia metallica TaxID=488729 RepID=UPI00157AC1C0|nr:MFS transporter [Burkholderia metallica]NTZ82503.1 MFS transporter [Burkholderia metallica]
MSVVGTPHSTSASSPGTTAWVLPFVFCVLLLLADGADNMILSYSLPHLRAEFHLGAAQAGLFGTITLIAMALGGIVGGWTMDRYGRVRTLVWSIVLFSLGTACLGFTQNFGQFAVVRFIGGLGLGSTYVTCNMLISEYVPTRHRALALGTLMAGWSTGYIVASLLAGWLLPTHGWRWLFYVTIVPLVFALLSHWLIPEPASWSEARARRVAGGHAPGGYRLIFSQPSHRRMFVLWTLTNFFFLFGYYGVANWLPTYLEKELHIKFSAMIGYMVGTYTLMIIGKILFGFLSDRVGRRAVYLFGSFATAVCLPFIVACQTPDNIVYLMWLFGFLYGIPISTNAAFMSESLPTVIRGTAAGGAYNLGRFGGAIAPVTIGLFADHVSIGAGFVLVAAMYFCTGLCATFIPEKVHDPQQAD